MARQAMGKGQMGKNVTPDIKVIPGTIATRIDGKMVKINNAIEVVISFVKGELITFEYNGGVYTVNKSDVEVL